MLLLASATRGGYANFKWGKLPHTGGRTLHHQISALAIEETMIRGFER
jgi:hypothetical protein